MGVGVSVVVAVDGGGSKTDVIVADAASGTVLSRGRGPGCSHHAIGIDAAVAVIDAAVRAALAEAGAEPDAVAHAGCYLTAIDLDEEQRAMTVALRALPWAARALAVENDVFALLRAGTDAPDAAVVVCGTGINGAAITADGRTARILALGVVSGDWGGASGLADEVLWHAARAEDGRGEPTMLRDAVASWTGRPDVHTVAVDIHTGALSRSALWPRIPDLMTIARAGDAVARSLVERQGREIAVLASSLLGRVGLLDRTVPVVLGGGIGSSGDPLMMAALDAELAVRAPAAQTCIATRPPVDGALDLVLQAARAG